MAEPEKRQIGDGSDNYSQATKQFIGAAKQVGKESAKQAAAAGTEATANAAAATVQAGAQGGKAAAEVASGTAAGGPWGAILSAAWALRHTLYKILVCTCLFFLVLVVMIVSLPSIVSNNIFGLDGTEIDMENPTSLLKSYEDLASAVSNVIDQGYEYSLVKVDQTIEAGGYDYELSREALINYAKNSSGYDVSYILAAYSASLRQKNTTKEDMLAKLRSVTDRMFPIACEEKTIERITPLNYETYRSVIVTVITSKTLTGTIDGVPQYRYTTAKRTYYEPDGKETTSEPIKQKTYEPVSVNIPIYRGKKIVGTKSVIYYETSGTQMLTPETELVSYVECTIFPFDQSAIIDAFGIDTNAQYEEFNITYGTAIHKMATALKMTLYGGLGGGQRVPLTDAELLAFVSRQDCNATRKHILSTGLSLVGKVPYFWGGKSAAGWNEKWNTPRLVTSNGASTSGTLRPYGLDCSGFTDWVFKTAMGISIRAGSSNQWSNSYPISKEELLPGDLGFMAVPGTVPINHVLMYAGLDETGKRMWVHCSSGKGVVLNSPSYVKHFRRPSNIDFDAPAPGTESDAALYTLEVEVTHYCPCKKCCGAHTDGYTASGKQAKQGMVAMSSHYPFGTQISINGVMYTVEDRGGSSIEENIHRVDIFVTDHIEALRLGRYTTVATVYRIGGQ